LFVVLDRFFLQGGQQCWALWAFLAACPCTLFMDVISLFVDWAHKDACLLAIGRVPTSCGQSYTVPILTRT